MEWNWLTDIVLPIIQTLGIPAVLGLGWQWIEQQRLKGNQATYATALLRAVGAGQQAAASRGLSLLTPAGRSAAATAGASYLMSTVPTTSIALGITTLAEHGKRIEAQIGAMDAQAVINASAAVAVALPSFTPNVAISPDSLTEIAEKIADRIAPAPGPLPDRPLPRSFL